MKSRNRITALLAVMLLAGLVDAETCAAQARRYRPSSPTVSPYLNLTRTNAGPLPNYYSIVRPLQVQRSINLQERALRQEQAGSLIRLQNEIQTGLAPIAPTGKSSGFLIQGRRSTFQSTSPYYNQPTALRSR